MRCVDFFNTLKLLNMKVTIIRKTTGEKLAEVWIPATVNVREAIKNILANLGVYGCEVDVITKN